MSRRALWIGIAMGLLSGCLPSSEPWSENEDVVIVHGGGGGGGYRPYEPWELTLQQLMRVRTAADATNDVANAESFVLDPDVADGAAGACQSDDAGHQICCDSGSSAGWCCVHAAPAGDTLVCI